MRPIQQHIHMCSRLYCVVKRYIIRFIHIEWPSCLVHIAYIDSPSKTQ